MNLIRELLAEIEEREEAKVPLPDLSAGDKNSTWAHLKLMEDDGLVELYERPMVTVPFARGHKQRFPTGPPTARMTSLGYDFLEGTRTRERWSKIKDALGRAGVALTVEAILLYIRKHVGE